MSFIGMIALLSGSPFQMSHMRAVAFFSVRPIFMPSSMSICFICFSSDARLSFVRYTPFSSCDSGVSRPVYRLITVAAASSGVNSVLSIFRVFTAMSPRIIESVPLTLPNRVPSTASVARFSAYARIPAVVRSWP